MYRWYLRFVALLPLAAIWPTSAALLDRGGGLIYDTVLDVTWLQDANYAKTSGYDSDGQMTWHAATAWAADLEYFDAVRGVSYTDWRLPTASPVNGTYWDYSWTYDGQSSDRSYNITSPRSELSYMYYVNLGLYGEYTADGVLRSDFGVFGNGTYTYGGQADVGPFINLQNAVYWTGVELGRNPYVNPASDYAWWFATQLGSQYFAIKDASVFAWAVRDGDVASVPEPSALGLALAALIAAAAVHRRRTPIACRHRPLPFPGSQVTV